MLRKMIKELKYVLLIVSIFLMVACQNDVEQIVPNIPDWIIPDDIHDFPTYTVVVVGENLTGESADKGVLVAIFDPEDGTIEKYIELLPAISIFMNLDDTIKSVPFGWRLPDATEMSYIRHWLREGIIKFDQTDLVLWTLTPNPQYPTKAIVLNVSTMKGGSTFRDVKARAAYVRDYTP